MDLRDIFFGLAWLVLGNLVFYLTYPIFSGIMTGVSDATVGEFGLTSTIVAVGWGGFILMWVLVGFAIPIYMLIKGASRD